MIATNENGTQYRLYDSVEDMLGAVQAGPECERYTTDFIGREFNSWAETFEAARGAWPEGIATLEGMIAELGTVELPRPKSRKRRTRFDEAGGDEVDYDRLRGGQDFWRVTRRESADGPATLTIFIDLGTPGFVESELILWRGAAGLVLTRLLEDAGYRVELWAVRKVKNVYRGNHPHNVTGVCLKRTGDPLDMATMINAVSGWFYRSILVMREKCLSPNKPKSSGGKPCLPSDADLDQFSRDTRRHVIAGVWGRFAAADLIRAKLAELT